MSDIEVKSLSVAQYLLDQCKANGDSATTPMQLLKLVYIAHGYMLGKYGQPLLKESVEAWRFGPVVPSVYHATKGFKDKPVEYVAKANKEFPFSAEEKETMDRVAKIYGKASGIVLSSATHRADTPWRKTWDQYGQNAPISNDLIEYFYGELLKKPRHSSL